MKVPQLFLYGIAILSGVNAFLLPAPRVTIESKLYGTTKSPPTIPFPKSISYGEESRKYRRTVYSHDDWVKHRAPDRFIRNTFSIIASGIYQNIGGEILVVTIISAFIVFWNALCGSYTDFDGVQHSGLLHDTALPALSLPLAPFTLLSSALGLLLVFRTNTGYQRWDEARKNWGMNINHTRDLVRMGTAWYDDSGVSPERRKEDLKALSLATWSFVRCMKRHLSPEKEDEEDFRKELYEKLPPGQAEAIIKAAHRPNRALFDLSVAIENLPMHWLRKNQINTAVTIFEDNLGSSERLLTSPVPLFYSRHTARFLFFWLALLPFALYEPFKDTWNHLGLIPATAVTSLFLFGIEELANQMEEPFTILPMQTFCDKIYNWCNEIVSFQPGDNGVVVHKNDYYNMEPVDIIESASNSDEGKDVSVPEEIVVSATTADAVETPKEHKVYTLSTTSAVPISITKFSDNVVEHENSSHLSDTKKKSGLLSKLFKNY